MEARFGNIKNLGPSTRRRRNSYGTNSDSGRVNDFNKSPSFVSREWSNCKKTVWTAGSKYNIIVSSLIGFVATFIMLLIFRPIFIMRKKEEDQVQSSTVEVEYMTHPQLIHNNHQPQQTVLTDSEYSISLGAVFLWSASAAGAIALLTYFTCRQSSSPPLPSPSSSYSTTT